MNEDLALAKSNKITEKVRIAIRCEFLDAFNRYKLGGVSASINSANFGQVTSVSGNRQLQVGARLDF